MATPLTHIILTESIYKNTFANSKKIDFLVWTLLPDIRYLDRSIPRDKFHTDNMNLEIVVSADSSFKKWVLFHSLLDQVRDTFYIEKWIYVRWWDEEFIIALKLLEDELLYDKISNWDTIMEDIHQFDYTTISDVNLDVLKKRYALLIQLMSRKPDNKSRELFMLWIWMSSEYITKINRIIWTIKADKKYESLIEELYSSFPNMITHI